MGTAQERLRDATAALGQTIQGEDIPPLQLPDLTGQDARTLRPRSASGPGSAAGPGRSRPTPRRPP
jgi:hypothetical protein